MRKTAILFATLALALSSALAQDAENSGKRTDIVSVISGKTCENGAAVLRFGKLEDGAGTFVREGMPSAMYRVGYGSLMIKRGEALHGHVVSVKKQSGMFFLSAEHAFHCQ